MNEDKYDKKGFSSILNTLRAKHDAGKLKTCFLVVEYSDGSVRLSKIGTVIDVILLLTASVASEPGMEHVFKCAIEMSRFRAASRFTDFIDTLRLPHDGKVHEPKEKKDGDNK